MIRICMMTHDRLERSDPRADLTRFKSLAEALGKASADIVLITSNERCRYEEGRYKGLKVCKIPLFSRVNTVQIIFFYLYLLPTLLRAKGGREFDVIFINSVFTVPAAWMLKWLSKGARIQFDLMGVLSEEKFIKRRRGFWNLVVKRVLSATEDFLWRRVDFITTINHQHERLVLERVTKPVYVVRDGVFERVWRSSFETVAGPVKNSRTILIFVGQINYFRLDPLFRVLPAVVAEVPELQLQVLGTGPQLGRYKQMVQDLGLESHVTFLGQIPHERVFDYIARADIGYSDDWSLNGFPTKVFEYMAMGKAVVVESTEGTRELLRDGMNALLYEDERELKEKIFLLARNERLREEIGNRARQAVGDHTWEKRAETLTLIYGRLLEGR